MDNRIFLHRRQRPMWIFIPSALYNGYIHSTAKNIYKIFWGPYIYKKPCWIGMLYYDKEANKNYWFTVENVLRARSLELPNGGVYIFPGNKGR